MESPIKEWNCPKCKKGKIKTETKLTDLGVETIFHDCDKCNHRIDINEIIETFKIIKP